METLIEVQGLSKRFGNLLAVDNISLDVRRGDVLGFLGPNAAGKSTTMKMITGFLAPTAGSITVCGHDVATDAIAAKAQQGYLPEGAPAYGEMTPARFLNFIADIRGLTASVKATRIRKVVEMVHLENVLDQPIETLSKGFKRRVGLAQAVLHDPNVLILDEPTDGLDPNQKHEVRTLIKEMASNKAIVISTHILEEVGAVCNRAIIIAQGRLVFSGAPTELAARSRYHNAITITVKSDNATDIKVKIGNIKGISDIEMSPREAATVRLTVIPQAGLSIAAAVQDVIRAEGWQIDELFIETGHLDEVFRNITAETGEVTRT